MQENLLYTLKESNLLNTNITAPAQVVASCLRERSVPGVCIIYFCNIHSCWPPAAAPLHRWLGFSTFSIIIKVQVLFCSTLKKYWLLAGQVDTADSPKHHSISRLKAPRLPPPTLTFGISHLAASSHWRFYSGPHGHSVTGTFSTLANLSWPPLYPLCTGGMYHVNQILKEMGKLAFHNQF